MATTVEEVLTKLRALGYGTDTEAAQIASLDGIHKRILNARRWTFLETQVANIPTVVGTGSYALTTFASNVKHIDALRLELNGSGLPLDYVNVQDFRDLENEFPENGTPRYWTRKGSSIFLWPKPDAIYKMTLDYIPTPTTLTAKANNVVIPDSHVDILAWATAMPITFRERDWDAHNFARQMYAELYAEMLAQYGMTDRQTTKHVVDSGWYDQYEASVPWLT